MHPWLTILTTTTTLAPVRSIGNATNAGRRRELGTVGGSSGEGRRGFEWTCSTYWRWGRRRHHLGPCCPLPFLHRSDLPHPRRRCLQQMLRRRRLSLFTPHRCTCRVGDEFGGRDSAIWEEENSANRKISGAPSRAHAWPRWIPPLSRVDDRRRTTLLEPSFFCVGAHAPVVLSRRDDAAVFGSARGVMWKNPVM
jgi:hypothetical protein